MITIIKTVFLGLVLIVASNITAHAEDWVFITLSPDGEFALYIDKDSLVFSDNKTWYWSKLEFAEPQESVKEGEIYSILHSFIEIDCAKKTFTNPYAIEKKKDGQVVWRGHIPARPDIPIPPDSIIEREFEFVCIKLIPR
ncbi:MAG TPA: surface-adhesin E family protein [Thermodesulfobacteriota bacterium]|nr:surface-adhesin E family protein [Thermodesulfobacteriota bacterium]